jgi:small subunit ribosomal protein S14
MSFFELKSRQINFFLKTRTVNRCILTGRPRSILRNWKVSRIAFRDLGRSGKISGLRKSSW